MSANPIGITLEGKYRIESKIGAGGFGTVYRAFHLGLGQPVAVKLLNAGLDHATEEDIARFRQEAASAFRLKHPNAVTVYDFGVTAEGIAYLVMELLEGRPLSQELYHGGAMTPGRAAEILIPVCGVLAEAHTEGIIHRDIKPDNIFLNQGKRGEVVKVVDFGIAKLVDAAATSGRNSSTGLVGTPAYMAPERLQNQSYDGRADVYSVGIMLYQMLAGRVPFKTTDPSNVVGVILMHVSDPPPAFSELGISVAANIEGIVRAALEKNPANRPTASEFARMLSEATGVVIPSLSSSSFPVAMPVSRTMTALSPSMSEIPTRLSDDGQRASALLPSTEAVPTDERAETHTVPLKDPATPRESSTGTRMLGSDTADRSMPMNPPPSKAKTYAAGVLGAVLLLGGGLFAAMKMREQTAATPPAAQTPAASTGATTAAPVEPASPVSVTPKKPAKAPAEPPRPKTSAPPAAVEPPVPPDDFAGDQIRRRREEMRKQKEREAEEARKRAQESVPPTVRIDPTWRNGVPPGVPPGLWRKWRQQQQEQKKRDRQNRRSGDDN